MGKEYSFSKSVRIKFGVNYEEMTDDHKYEAIYKINIFKHNHAHRKREKYC